jgi:hypothetical protein
VSGEVHCAMIGEPTDLRFEIEREMHVVQCIVDFEWTD